MKSILSNILHLALPSLQVDMTIPLTSGGFSRGEGLKKKKALLIGISYQKSDAKKSLGELDSPHEDVLTLRKFLIGKSNHIRTVEDL
jgi:hypothetical protein